MFSVVPKPVVLCTHTFRSQLCGKKSRAFQQEREGSTIGDYACPSLLRGIDYIKNPRFNKGLAFTLKERQALGVHGLLASAVKTQQDQIEICKLSLDRHISNLNKYLYLAELYDMNERLFYSLIDTDIEKYMPIIYTPTVGLACQTFGIAYRRPRGLFISIHDKGNIMNILNNWPRGPVRAICFTDGERILGLGDLGAYGMGIPIGKLALYTALAGVKPDYCLPVLIDVGTNNEKLLTDPLYIGIREKRVKGQPFFDLIDEFMRSARIKFGSNTLLQFEDFSVNTATTLLRKYQHEYCTFNDDIQGTASVVVAGLIAATRVVKKKLSELTYMFLGAGSAATGIANLIVLAMQEDGVSEKDGRNKMYMFDLDGFLSNKRPKGIPDHAKEYGRDEEPENDFYKLVEKYKPTVLIGVSTKGGTFTEQILKLMKSYCERPIVFALSNPTSKAECTAQQCYDFTEGACIYASGSPFPPVNYKGQKYLTGQGNNSYVFPGIALGVICCAAHNIRDECFLVAAKTLAKFVTEQDLQVGRLYPPISDIKNLSLEIALSVIDLCYKCDLATVYPRPSDMKRFVKSHIYDLCYPDAMPKFFEYPKSPPIQLRSLEEIYKEQIPKKKGY